MKSSKPKWDKGGELLTIQDVIGDKGIEGSPIFDQIVVRDVFERIHLDPDVLEILVLRFGLFETTEHTLEEIGDIFGVTRERVRQKIQMGLEKMASYLEGEY